MDFGPIVIVVILLVAFPVGFLMSGAVASALWGTWFSRDSKKRHEGSELVEFNSK